MPTPTVQASQSSWESLYSILRIAVPLIGGSISTLIGMAFQRKFNQRDKILEETYTPLLSKISDLSEGDLTFLDESVEVRPIWTGFNAHQKHHLPKDIRDDVEDLDKIIGDLSQFFTYFTDELASEGRYHNSGKGILMSSTDVKPNMVYKKQGGHTQGYKMWKWISTYAAPVLKASNSSELESLLLDKGEALGTEYKSVFHHWDDEQFERIFIAIKESSDRVEWFNEIEDQGEAFNHLQKKSDEVESDLEREINKHWMRVLFT